MAALHETGIKAIGEEHCVDNNPNMSIVVDGERYWFRVNPKLPSLTIDDVQERYTTDRHVGAVFVERFPDIENRRRIFAAMIKLPFLESLSVSDRYTASFYTDSGDGVSRRLSVYVGIDKYIITSVVFRAGESGEIFICANIHRPV